MAAVFDGLVLFAFRDNAELLGAWVSARNVAWPAAEPVKEKAPEAAEVKPAA